MATIEPIDSYGQSINFGDYDIVGSDVSSTKPTPQSKSAASDVAQISVIFLFLNIVGTGLLLFVGNLWSEVFSNWMNEIQESPIFYQDSNGNIIQPQNNQDASKTNRGFWVALIATIVAIFIIWGLIKFYNISKNEVFNKL